MKPLALGMKHSYTYTVPENKTVPYLYPEDKHFNAMPKVFGTGFLVGLIEMTCMQGLEAYLEEGEGSVGIHIDVSHSAPTPPGMNVTVSIVVSKIDRRKITWDVEAKDERSVISKGTHQRYVVHWDRFMEKVKGD